MGTDTRERAILPPMVGSQRFSTDEELVFIKNKYEDLCRQMDQILTETMERSNRIVMDTEISNLIMSQVFNASNDGIWAVDKSYRVIRVNKRLLDLLGLSAQEVIGQKCYELLMGRCRDHCDCPMEKIAKGEAVLEQEKSLKFRSGKTIPFQVTSTPLSNLDQSIIGMVETFTDITERKNVERRLHLANKQLEKQAIEDGLTKLCNRRRFDQYLDIEWRRQSRAQHEIALVMCDVDFFKKYNDHYGHQSGDVCLRSVADSIRKRVRRSSDLVARYGGEEFAIIMPETDIEGARHVAERMRRELTEERIPHGCSAVAPFVTISCGIAAILPSSNNKPQLLIEMADQALYRAKQCGRNRVVSYQDLSLKPVSVA